jgi:2-dehydro-3-deoxy-L-rhamnonate dehydrogenase (NAD+)
MNQIDLQGRVAIVTGGAQGIGYACAERMLRCGAAVLLWDIDTELLARAGQRLGEIGSVGTTVVELSDEAAVVAAGARAIAERAASEDCSFSTGAVFDPSGGRASY